MSSTSTEKTTTSEAPGSADWREFDGYSHLVGSGMTFRTYSYFGNGSSRPAHAHLQLLTNHGWIDLSKVYCGDTYHGLHLSPGEEELKLRRYAEFLIGIGAVVSTPPEKN
jgi:hypothetical protein